MFNNFVCFLYLTSFAFKGVYNFSNEINNTLEKGEVMPSFYKDDNKYYYNIASKTMSNSIYKPYTYNINNGVYNLKDDLSVPQEITMKNFNSRINVIYSTYPNNFEFQESKFSYHIIEIEDFTNGPFNPYRDNREYYILNRRWDGDSLVIHTFIRMYLPKNPPPPLVVELQHSLYSNFNCVLLFCLR